MRELRASQSVLQTENDKRGERIRQLEADLASSRQRLLEATEEHDEERRRLHVKIDGHQQSARQLEVRLARTVSTYSTLSKVANLTHPNPTLASLSTNRRKVRHRGSGTAKPKPPAVYTESNGSGCGRRDGAPFRLE